MVVQMDWNISPLQLSLSFLSRTIIQTWNRKLFTVFQMRIRLTRLEFSLTELTHHFSLGQDSLTCPAMCLLSILTTSLFLSPSRETHPRGQASGRYRRFSKQCLLHSLCHSSHTLSTSEENNLQTNTNIKQQQSTRYNNKQFTIFSLMIALFTSTGCHAMCLGMHT